jgi:hypothetical protein
MRIAVSCLIGFALALAAAPAAIAAEPDGRRSDNPHSRRNAILDRVSLKPGILSEREQRMRAWRAESTRGKIEETDDKVLRAD